MVRIGFRAWLAFLLIGWGGVAVCFMFISSAWSFYLLRLLLGAFESGAFPAMWHALGVFFPRRRCVAAGVQGARSRHRCRSSVAARLLTAAAASCLARRPHALRAAAR